MNINQAKTLVATTLGKLGVDSEQISAVIDMTRRTAIIEAAEIIEFSDDISLDKLQPFLYWPDLDNDEDNYEDERNYDEVPDEAWEELKRMNSPHAGYEDYEDMIYNRGGILISLFCINSIITP